jgi:flagellar biosynthetic protein FlhB
MAKPEATEKATPKRKSEARGRGQVARSHDISGSAIFLAIITALHIGFMGVIGSSLQAFSIALLTAGSRDPLTIRSVGGLFVRALWPYTGLIALVFVSALVLAVLSNVLQFGFLFSPALLKPKFAKLNPLPGFQRVFFSTQTLVQFAKQALKLTIVLVLCCLGIKDNLTTLYALAHYSPHDMLVTVEGIIYWVALKIGMMLLLLGLLDYVWERKRLEDSLKMTKTEVKDEHKQSEGNPEAKAALRQRARAMARRRMMAAIPKATVVVTNPTHFAVALEWDELTMEAPVLTAKGADLIAKRIRELAEEHAIPVVENAPLARTLYAKVELDSPVPADLYAAVAQVVAFVYKLKNRTIA